MNSFKEADYLIALVDDDPDQAQLLQSRLKKQGYRSVAFSSPTDLQKALLIGDYAPDALIMDIMFPEGELHGAESLQELALAYSKPLPVICVSSRKDQEARLAALRAGAAAYMTKPLDFRLLAARLENLLKPQKRYRVLVVDDDDLLLELYAGILEGADFEVTTLDDPSQFLAVYEAFDPDVVLLDIQMPDVSGIELAGLLSEAQGVQRSGIIFLSGESERKRQLEALEAGGDDFILKPPQASELVASVTARAKAARRLRRLGRNLQLMNQEIKLLNDDMEREHEALNRHAIVSVADARGRITYVNRRFCQVSGYQSEELLGQDHRLLKSGQHSPAFYRDLWQTITSGLVWQGEVCNRTKDGSYYWVESTITPFFDDKGRIKEYVSIRTDITRVKNIELALRQSEKEQKFLAWDRGERIKEARCLSDVMHRVTDDSLSIDALLGAAVDLIPQGWKMPEATWARICFAGQVFTSKNFKETACSQKASKGIHLADDQDEEVLLEVFTNPQSLDPDLEGEACRIFLPEEKKLLEQLAEQLAQAIGRRMDRCALIQAKEEADRANKAKSSFLSSMSHELRTPMNAILGFAQMLEYDDDLDEEQRDNAHEIIKAGKHLLTLINDVLDLAKIEAGKVSVSMEIINLKDLAEEYVPLLQPMAQKRGIRLETAFLPHQQVEADRVRLKQVLLNLCSNAIKYNRDAGRVKVDAQQFEEGWLRIRVEDTGPGIPEDQLETLAQPFNRLENENSGIEGTGIGLTISKKLVLAMDGRFGVESQLNVGSVFWVELRGQGSQLPGLPLVTPAAEPGMQDLDQVLQAENQNQNLKKYRVLSIDDNPANLKLIEMALKKRSDLQVVSAHLPGIGLEMAMAEPPDLILLDINLPSMDGYQLLRVLQSDLVLKKIPVIAVTANALPNEVDKGLQAGFKAYLSKPLDFAALNETLDTWLGEKANVF